MDDTEHPVNRWYVSEIRELRKALVAMPCPEHDSGDAQDKVCTCCDCHAKGAHCVCPKKILGESNG